MSSRHAISRRDFLHGLFSRNTEDGPTIFENISPEQDFLSLLPPEFSGSMLKMEAARLGGDPEKMTEQEMAALVVKAMYGTAQSAPRQEAIDTALEQERVPVD
ncbi:MAG: hypothetical protein IJB29_01400 [Mailhella sp.]|nr:hypothetical protein [Mailhella sp.]